MKHFSEEQTRVAANWWFDVIAGPPQTDIGAPEDMALLIAIREALAKEHPVNESQREDFCDAMIVTLNEMGPYGFVSCDYDPCPVLADAMDAAGIHHGRAPLKTVMHLDPGKTKVRRGYMSPFETIWEAK